MIRSPSTFVLSFLGALVCSVNVVATESGHVRARLVSDLDRLGDPRSFKLGVVLEPEPGWHIYWRNPGGAGLATEVAFELPDGLRAGALQWPAPISFNQPGDIIGYGYESPVLLAAEVVGPTTIDRPVPVTVTASWLACRDICVLGEAELEAELPFTGVALQRSLAAFEGWRDSLPVPAEPSALDMSVTGGPISDRSSSALTVWLHWADPPRAVEFFPDPGPSLKVGNTRTHSRGQLTRIDFDVTQIQGTAEPASSLSSVVVTTDAEGRRTARSLTINLD